jgi:hypothetical protein
MNVTLLILAFIEKVDCYLIDFEMEEREKETKQHI